MTDEKNEIYGKDCTSCPCGDGRICTLARRFTERARMPCETGGAEWRV